MSLKTRVITSKSQKFILDLALQLVSEISIVQSRFSYPNAPVLLHKPERLSLIPLSGSTAAVYEPERFLARLLEDLSCCECIVQTHLSSDIIIGYVSLAKCPT